MRRDRSSGEEPGLDFSEKHVKTIAKMIGELSTEKHAVLGQWLDDNLTTAQKEKLSKLLTFARNEATIAS